MKLTTGRHDPSAHDSAMLCTLCEFPPVPGEDVIHMAYLAEDMAKAIRALQSCSHFGGCLECRARAREAEAAWRWRDASPEGLAQ